MWKDRSRHAEALETNSVGFIKLRPDPSAYMTANGMVNPNSRNELSFSLAKAMLKEGLRASKVVVSFAGEATVSIVLAGAADGADVLRCLDAAALTHQFSLDLWAPKEPDAVWLGGEGQRVEVPE